ncbi:hypothetical protein B5F40_10185 [Gordonibacter sp. An230]|uniref:hypothetical protein n=1 Tax=Gordonibacter sp. An230 TaxID=1965592 RepID=UPI000B36D091|nr:hypothetical protein [Gordonibacter sp. An230]OUO89597.1 hypothetical protein B5F40_10185 [Gordonibacter sp. An230]
MNRGIDAATAFARLYHRWFDDPLALADEGARQAHSVVGEQVVDMLALWDERARSWLPGTPTILRLETHDLTAFAMRAPHIALFFGAINAEPSMAAPGCALRWESFRPCSYAIGRTVIGIALETDGDGLLVGAEAVLDDGGRVALGGSVARSLPCAV